MTTADYALSVNEFNARIDTLESAIQRGDEVWSDAEELAREAAQQSDQRRYILGDIACLIKTRYGEDTLGEFAKDIQVTKKQLQEYRTTCAFWTRTERNRLLTALPRLSYSMLRLTASRRMTPAEAIDFLQEVDATNMTVEAARVALKQARGDTLPPRKVADVHVCVTALDDRHGTMTVAFTGGLMPPVQTGQSYRLVMHEESV